MQMRVVLTGDQRLAENVILEVRALAKRHGLKIPEASVVRQGSAGSKSKKYNVAPQIREREQLEAPLPDLNPWLHAKRFHEPLADLPMITGLGPALLPFMERGKTEVAVRQEGLQVELGGDRNGCFEHAGGGFEGRWRARCGSSPGARAHGPRRTFTPAAWFVEPLAWPSSALFQGRPPGRPLPTAP